MRLLRNIWYSFPMQLGLLHVRRYLFMVLPWILLGMMVLGYLAKRLGFNYLFLDPEYLGKVNFWSFFLVGIALGGFTFVWNVTSYILNSFRFPFLATFKRPFLRYSLNNAFFPLVFFVIYFFTMIQFQYYSELKTFGEVLTYQAAIISGMILTLIITFSGFLNAQIEDLIKRGSKRLGERSGRKRRFNVSPAFGNNKNSIHRDIRVDFLLIHPMRVRPVRQVLHYDPAALVKVFRLHHKNALFIELSALFLLFLIGAFMEVPFFQIPAASSLLLFMAILLAPIGALSYWLRSWAFAAFVSIVIIINLLVKVEVISRHSEAYGLSYKGNLPSYDLQSIAQAANTDTIAADYHQGLEMLNAWKKKVSKDENKKPALILINASGGGLKATLWAFRLNQIADSITHGRFFDHCVLITGASGGMMGEAYYRELSLHEKLGDPIDVQDSKYISNISKDILNAVCFTLVVNDLLIRWHSFTVDSEEYEKDRGYIFEKRFSQNTNYILDKPLMEYKSEEQQASIPTMVFTPTIINDGRRLLVSASPVSYLSRPPKSDSSMLIDGIDYQQFFKNQHPENLSFLSAIRMNSTFPFVLPNVYLPSKPMIQCMDAGLRDNYGLETSMRFLYTFKDWINQNCSRVVIVQSRGDYPKQYEPIVNQHPSLITQLTDPITSLYLNWTDYQNYHQDQTISMAHSWLSEPLNVLPFQYVPQEKDKEASMSLHLTKSERQNILLTIYKKDNMEMFRQLDSYLER